MKNGTSNGFQGVVKLFDEQRMDRNDAIIKNVNKSKHKDELWLIAQALFINQLSELGQGKKYIKKQNKGMQAKYLIDAINYFDNYNFVKEIINVV